MRLCACLFLLTFLVCASYVGCASAMAVGDATKGTPDVRREAEAGYARYMEVDDENYARGYLSTDGVFYRFRNEEPVTADALPFGEPERSWRIVAGVKEVVEIDRPIGYTLVVLADGHTGLGCPIKEREVFLVLVDLRRATIRKLLTLWGPMGGPTVKYVKDDHIEDLGYKVSEVEGRQGGEEPSGPDLHAAVESMRSYLPADRLSGARELSQVRQELIQELVQLLPHGRALETSFNGTANLAALTLGEWRASEAVGPLAANMTFQLSRATLPESMKLEPSAPYPMAAALAKIGNADVVKAVIKRIQESDDERALSVGTWVLWRAYGEAAARALLNEAIGSVHDEQQKTRLESAVKLLPKGDALLPPPE